MKPNIKMLTLQLLAAALFSLAIFQALTWVAGQAKPAPPSVTEQDLLDVYAKGFAEGVASINPAKLCTAWWFGADKASVMVRHKQAQQAYCKGKV